jgi:hypothetical protein
MGYRVSVKDKYLTVYEPVHDEEDIRHYLKCEDNIQRAFIERLASLLPPDHPVAARTLELLETLQTQPKDKDVRKMLESSRVSPILRFVLLDKKKRIFGVERMTFLGEGGWHSLCGSLPLKKAVKKYLHHLGKESFFDLF